MVFGVLAVSTVLLPSVVSAQFFGKVPNDPSRFGSTPAALLTNPGSVSTCVTQCFTEAAQGVRCHDVADVVCVCNMPLFPVKAGQCIQSRCPNDIAPAEELYGQACAVVASAALSSLFLGPPYSLSASEPRGSFSRAEGTTTFTVTLTQPTSVTAATTSSTSAIADSTPSASTEPAETPSQSNLSSRSPSATIGTDGDGQAVTTSVTEAAPSNTNSAPLNPPANSAASRTLRQRAGVPHAILVASGLIALGSL